MAGLGPAPFCAMLLADMGAEVLRIVRPGAKADAYDILSRGRCSVEVDLRAPGMAERVLDLVSGADVLIEGFRPGVMERLGLGPDKCLARNSRLVYGRMTGWGQHGPLAHCAGHDLNYIAITGALHAIGRPGEAPVPPLNYVGDFGGGAMLLAFGLLAALHETGRSGKGQVVDAAMTEGAASLMMIFFGLHAAGSHSLERGKNLLDSGSAIYETYECADGRYISIAPIELKFREVLFELLGLPFTRDDGSDLRSKLEKLFKTRSRDNWCALLEGTDACFAPVLDMEEAPYHPHNVARGSFVEVDGVVQPAPAPRFSRTPAGLPTPPREPGEGSRTALADWGIEQARINALFAARVLSEPATEREMAK